MTHANAARSLVRNVAPIDGSKALAMETSSETRNAPAEATSMTARVGRSPERGECDAGATARIGLRSRTDLRERRAWRAALRRRNCSASMYRAARRSRAIASFIWNVMAENSSHDWGCSAETHERPCDRACETGSPVTRATSVRRARAVTRFVTRPAGNVGVGISTQRKGHDHADR